MPLGKYEDSLELSINQFVILSSPISLGQIIYMCYVKIQTLMLLVAKLAGYFCIEQEL